MTDLSTESDDSFSPEEQAQFDAMRSGDQGPVVERQPEPEPRRPEPPAQEGSKAPGGGKGEPEAKETDDGDPDPKNPGEFVRHAKFHQERERRRALEADLAKEREAKARLDERLRIFGEAMQRPKAEQPEKPVEPAPRIDPKEDIFGAYEQLKADLEALRTGQTQQADQFRQSQQQREERERASSVVSAYRQDLSTAIQADPTVKDAYEHLIQGRFAEFKLFGMSDDDARAALHREEFEVAQAALSQGQSPAAILMNLAKGRGFVAKVAAVAAEPVKESAAERAARAQAGQSGPGRSLSSVGGDAAGSMPTVEQLASMSESEFERFAKKNPGALAALMGG